MITGQTPRHLLRSGTSGGRDIYMNPLTSVPSILPELGPWRVREPARGGMNGIEPVTATGVKSSVDSKGGCTTSQILPLESSVRVERVTLNVDSAIGSNRR